MVWKVRADCTYTTANNKNSRQTAVENLMSSYPTAILPTYEDSIGRFPSGITSHSTTRFTVSYDFESSSDAIAFKNALGNAVRASARNATLISVHEAPGFD